MKRATPPEVGERVEIIHEGRRLAGVVRLRCGAWLAIETPQGVILIQDINTKGKAR